MPSRESWHKAISTAAGSAKVPEELNDDDYFVEHTCKANCRKVLKKLKGMSKDEAKLFIKDHLEFNCEFTNREDYTDPDCLRTLQHSVTFRRSQQHQTDTQGSKAAPTHVTCHYRYHHRPRSSWCEHYAELKYELHTASGKATSGFIFDIDIDEKRMHKFMLTSAGADAICTVFPPGWQNIEALLFLYAALGVKWEGSLIRLSSPAEEPAQGYYAIEGFIEPHTQRICGLEVHAEIDMSRH